MKLIEAEKIENTGDNDEWILTFEHEGRQAFVHHVISGNVKRISKGDYGAVKARQLIKAIIMAAKTLDYKEEPDWALIGDLFMNPEKIKRTLVA